MSEPLKAPFSYFGNKKIVSQIVWSRLGNPNIYIEPFFGSGAVYLARPSPQGVELINDKDGFIANVWRAITYKPEETARLAVYPPSEVDIISRHRWLMEIGKPKLDLLKTDPFYFDPQIAAWYIYTASCYVGGGLCDGKSHKNQKFKIPKHTREGIFREGNDGDVDKVIAYFKSLSRRMQGTKIACGDWDRVVTPAWITTDGICSIFADPPYDDLEHSISYSAGGGVAQAVRLWAIESGENRNLRIAVCGYESDSYRFPETWETFKWKAGGGYGNQGNGRGRENAGRERIWFSPNCIKPNLFQFMSQDQSEVVIPEDELEIDEPIAEIELPELIQPEPEVIILSKEIIPVIKKEYTQTDLFEFMSD
jgi:site-specific DNA-adenine methylase